MKKIIIHNHYAHDAPLAKPLKGHPFHTKTDEELRYIIKDAGEAARAMQGHSPRSEGKYLDQMHDAGTVLRYREKGGKREVAAQDAGGVRIVQNKLLGGWFVVRGSSDTPLSGKFPSKEAAQAWLDQRGAKDDEKPSPEKIRTLYKSWTSGGQKPSEAIGELADNFGMSEAEVKRIVGR